MKYSQDYNRLLDKKGIQLGDLGLSDIALERDDALIAVNLLRNASIPILGGDFFSINREKLRLHMLTGTASPRLVKI